jgi:hypothetical protein
MLHNILKLFIVCFDQKDNTYIKIERFFIKISIVFGNIVPFRLTNYNNKLICRVVGHILLSLLNLKILYCYVYSRFSHLKIIAEYFRCFKIFTENNVYFLVAEPGDVKKKVSSCEGKLINLQIP